MAPAAKRPVGKGKEAIGRLTAQALRALQDPAVRAELVNHSRAVMETAQQWVASRRKTSDRPIGERMTERVGSRFGQRGLERREANLRAAVVALSTDSPALASSLRPVTHSLDDVARLLKVAAALPFAKRKRAHRRIDHALDDLESSLFDAVLDGAEPTSDQA